MLCFIWWKYNVSLIHSVPYLFHSWLFSQSFVSNFCLVLSPELSSDCVSSLKLLKRGNFRCTESSVGVEAQLGNLASITQVIDPKLHQHLGICLSILVFFIAFVIPCLKSKAKHFRGWFLALSQSNSYLLSCAALAFYLLWRFFKWIPDNTLSDPVSRKLGRRWLSICFQDANGFVS